MKRLLLILATAFGLASLMGASLAGCQTHNPRSEACDWLNSHQDVSARWVSNGNYRWGGYCVTQPTPVWSPVIEDCSAVILARNEADWYSPRISGVDARYYCSGLR